jgi:hypothetical protein
MSVSCDCCELLGGVSAMCRSLVQRSRRDCVEFVCVISKPKTIGGLGSIMAVTKKNICTCF